MHQEVTGYVTPATDRGQQPQSLGFYIAALIGGLVLGVVVSFCGTAVHRQWFPGLLIAALIATVSAGVWAMSWRGIVAGIGYVTAWGATTLILASQGPGGDVLIAGSDLGGTPVVAGVIWLNLGTICAALALLLATRRGQRLLAAKNQSDATQQDLDQPPTTLS